MTASNEFSRPIRIDTIGSSARSVEIEADLAERDALARRFDLPGIEHLSAEVSLSRSGDAVAAQGRLTAQVVQSCVATGQPVPASIDEPFRILFTPAPKANAAFDEEIELSEDDCDVVFYDSGSIDIGEAVAETLSLSLDPWPRAPGAEEALSEAGVKSEGEVGPFAALAQLRDKLKK